MVLSASLAPDENICPGEHSATAGGSLPVECQAGKQMRVLCLFIVVFDFCLVFFFPRKLFGLVSGLMVVVSLVFFEIVQLPVY